MLERDCNLQTAVDVLTEMQAQRVADYIRYKSQLPSFGPEVDAELARYNKAIEQYTQGTVVWYYHSPREYFAYRDSFVCAPLLMAQSVILPLPSSLRIASSSFASRRRRKWSTGYFRGQDVIGKREIVVPVYERTVPAADQPTPTPTKRSVPSTNSPMPLPSSDSYSPKLLYLPRFSHQYHARLSLLIISLVACLLYVSYVTFPALPPLSPRMTIPH